MLFTAATETAADGGAATRATPVGGVAATSEPIAAARATPVGGAATRATPVGGVAELIPPPPPPPPPSPTTRLRRLESDYEALVDINTRQENRIESLHSKTTELIGFYLVFQGMIFTSVAQAKMLRCHNWFFPFSLSCIAAIAIIFPLFRLLLNISISKIQLLHNRSQADRLLHLIMLHKFTPSSSLSPRFPSFHHQSSFPNVDFDAYLQQSVDRSRSDAPNYLFCNGIDFNQQNSNLHQRHHASMSIDSSPYPPATVALLDRVYPYACSSLVLLILLFITSFVLLSCRRLLCDRS